MADREHIEDLARLILESGNADAVREYRKGGRIFIKKENRGKFTALKKRTGKSASWFKAHGTPAQKKMAVFELNAKKWKHADGGPLDTLLRIFKSRPTVEEPSEAHAVVDYSGLKTTNNRKYNPEYISYISNSLKNSGISDIKRASILANIIEESGGNPFALDSTGKFYGLLQWAGDRYAPTKEKDVYKEIDNQLKYITDTIGNSTDKKSWTHGGSGSGYNSLKDAMADFDSDDLDTAMKGFTLGYVRPAGKIDSYNNRLKVARQLYELKGFKPFDVGGLVSQYGAEKIRETLAKRGFEKGGDRKVSFWNKAVSGLAHLGDARIGAVGAQHIRDLYAEGRDDEARQLSKNYALANGFGIGAAAAGSGAFGFLLNPATASTDLGAALATGIDAAGFASGANELSKDVQRISSGEYSVRDIPLTLLNTASLVPGMKQFSDMGNIARLSDAAQTIAAVPKITSEGTLLNRITHPLESYRFSKVARSAEDVLPADIYEQTLDELSRTTFLNRPVRFGDRTGYWFLNRKPADKQLGVMHGWYQPERRWLDPKVYALGDRTAKSMFSRGHEVGHIVEDAATKLGYRIGNYPSPSYEYVAGETFLNTPRPEKLLSEHFADVFGNSVTSDMVLESSKVLNNRYNEVKNLSPMFLKK